MSYKYCSFCGLEPVLTFPDPIGAFSLGQVMLFDMTVHLS